MSARKCPHTKDDCHACGECRKKIAELNAAIDRLNAMIDKKLMASYAGHPGYAPKRKESE
jgi:cytidine deaminase